MSERIGRSKSALVAETIEQEIKSGRFPKGQQLASESSLMNQFSVSRNTVRKGLDQLARKGLITTKTGIGSFVAYADETLDSSLGWTLALSQSDREITTQILSVERRNCQESASALGIEQADFLCIDRLRSVATSSAAISLERSRLPWRDAYTQVIQEGEFNGSLQPIFDRAGLIVGSGEEWANVLPSLGEHDAHIMNRRVGEPMLKLTRVTRTVNNEPLERVESILDPARFGLHLEF